MARASAVVATALMCLVGVTHADTTPAAGRSTKTVWDIAQLGLFDRANKAYALTDGRVEVDLAETGPQCPTGLGHLVSGRDTVRSIRLAFDCPEPGEYWLHIRWTPGGSGREQFAVLVGDEVAAKTRLVKAEDRPNAMIRDTLPLRLVKGPAALTLDHLSGDGLRFQQIALSRSPQPPHPVRPDLKYPTLASYEREIQEPGILLDGEHVTLFAPRARQAPAKAVFERLTKAYEVLYSIVGVHTKYKMVVYHFPEGHPDGWGGTSECVIWYSYKNLDPNAWPEWRRYKVPHVSGHIEEMAHNFVSATGTQFGWEMVGWTLGVQATRKVAASPFFTKNLVATRRGQMKTFQQYTRGGYIFPDDLGSNQVDRIHAHILRLCERRYGGDFWPDFFAEIRKAQGRIADARRRWHGDERRNALYRISVDCFDRLDGIEFKSMLKRYRISLTTDVKSLKVEDDGWDRRLLAPGE